jgi:hypothetical protein
MVEKNKNIAPVKEVKVRVDKRLNKMANTTYSTKKIELANKFGTGKIVRKSN